MSKYAYTTKQMERVEELIYKYKQPESGVIRYMVRANKERIHVRNTFATLEEARTFKQYYIDCVAKARLQKKQSMKEFNKNTDHLEYPETLLAQLDITPEAFGNYYDEIVPNFNENIKRILDKEMFSDRERYCLMAYYKDVRDLEDIGKSLDVTRERIRQIIGKAIRKLKHPTNRDMLLQGKDKFELISINEKEEIIKEFKEKIGYDLIIEWIGNHEITEELLDVCHSIINTYNNNKPKGKEETPIEDLDLSVRSYNCLKRWGINTLKDLTSMTRDGMMKVRNLGRKSLKEVESKLKEIGLSFKGDEEEKKMKKKYKVNYTWYSGECFGAGTYKETIVEIDDGDLESWKYYFEKENIDGSYCSINSIKEVNENE